MADTSEQATNALLVRNVTTIGHVDHGKTTLMDALLAANNIISSRMAGKIRYLDSREDEQQRGITMESSAVSLRFKVLGPQSASGPGRTENSKTFVVNMIDTPGHVDFSSEVSTASRLCDGALVLVDVVEGVCTQTIAVLRQAWLDRLRPVLIINKFDRLITELKLSPIEAYHHLSQLIEQVNAVMGGFFAGERMEDDLRWREGRERRLAAKREAMADKAAAEAAAEPNGTVNGDSAPDTDGNDPYQERDDEDLYFAPEKGNVVFASAIDGWGFRIGKFAQLYANKLGIKEANFKRVLWGDFYLDTKTKRVVNHKQLKGRNLKPLFVQFVLENIWAVYDAIILNPNPDKVSKIVATLNLKIPPRELKSKDTRNLLQLIMSQWLSLSTCIIQSTIDIVPPPSSAQLNRIPKILYPDLLEPTIPPKNKLERDLWKCDDGGEAFVVGYVSKMFAVPVKELPENKKVAVTIEQMRANAKAARERAAAASLVATVGPNDESPCTTGAADDQESDPEGKGKEEVNEDEDVLLGFARIYSGTIKVGSKVRCVLPKYNNNFPPTHLRNIAHTTTATVEGLYTMMGKDLVRVNSVPAGNVFAIRGLEGKVMRSATICAPSHQGLLGEEVEAGSSEYVLNLGGVLRPVYPIVRVALEPQVPVDMPKLVKGLKLLSQADPCVETFQQQTGEHVILAAGELHLERCLKDLRERFAKVEIQASKPIVPFRETAVKAAEMAPPKYTSRRGLVDGSSAQGLVKFSIRAAPLPKPLLDFVLDNISILKRLQRERKNAHGGSVGDRSQGREDDDDDGHGHSYDSGETFRKPTVRPDRFWTALEDVCAKAGGDWDRTVVDRIWAFGPHKAGGCLLIDARKKIETPNSLRRRLDRTNAAEAPLEALRINEDGVAEGEPGHHFDHHVETGFQLATFQGPLCSEPVEGIAYFLESLNVASDESRSETGVQPNHAQVSGSLMTAVRDACRNGLLDWSPRLMLAMYSCDIQAATDVLGKVYGVVAKRRGRIVAEEMKEGTSFFTVTALLPVAESFGFADDIRKRTSGAASPQLIFSGYEMLDVDPFWVPTTEEELEDLGEKADRENVAKAYMDSVRERKGLFVDRKIVEFAEKQRTLKR